MHNPESILENEMHKILWNSEKQTDHLISVRWPNLVIAKKRTCQIVDFVVPTGYRVKLTKSEKRDQYRDLAKELKKLWNMKMMVIPIVIGILDTVTKGMVLGLEDLEIKGQVKTIETKALLRSARKPRRELRRLSETPMENHQLTLVWKTLKRVK